MTTKRSWTTTDRVWVAAVLDCHGAITLNPSGANLGLGLTVTAKNEAIADHVCELCGGKTRNISELKHNTKHMRWNIFGKRARKLLRRFKPGDFYAKKSHVVILRRLFNELEKPEKMDTRKVRRDLIKFNKLSVRGYAPKRWAYRVDKFIAAVKDARSCTF